MNEEIKQLWVNALRSGEYEQGNGYLRVGNKFCCLGVLCDLAAKAGVVSEINPAYDGVAEVYAYSEEEREKALLPREVILWAGLPGSDPDVQNDEDDPESLANLNDSHGWNFNQIADAIERDL